jgi:hypothetical protein
MKGVPNGPHIHPQQGPAEDGSTQQQLMERKE